MKFHSNIKLETTIQGLYLGAVGTPSSSPVSTIQAYVEGFRNDRHYGTTKHAGVREGMYPKGTTIRNNRQWSAISDVELHEVAQKLGVPEIKPEWIGANILFSGVRMTQLPPLSRIVINKGQDDSASLIVYGENNPCTYGGQTMSEYYNNPALATEFVKAAMHTRGNVGWVEKAGVLRVGDTARIYVPDFYPAGFVERSLQGTRL